MVDVTAGGIEVRSGTHGTGTSAGQAANAQEAGAQGGVKNVKKVTVIESDGKDLYQVEHTESTAGRSSSGHKASSINFGNFKVVNQGGTVVKTPGLPSLPKPPGKDVAQSQKRSDIGDVAAGPFARCPVYFLVLSLYLRASLMVFFFSMLIPSGKMLNVKFPELFPIFDSSSPTEHSLQCDF